MCTYWWRRRWWQRTRNCTWELVYYTLTELYLSVPSLSTQHSTNITLFILAEGFRRLSTYHSHCNLITSLKYGLKSMHVISLHFLMFSSHVIVSLTIVMFIKQKKLSKATKHTRSLQTLSQLFVNYIPHTKCMRYYNVYNIFEIEILFYPSIYIYIYIYIYIC